MTDRRVLVVESDAERADNFQQLLEFADFDPFVVPAVDKVPWEDCAKPGWLAALVHDSDDFLKPMLSDLNRHGADLPVVTLGSASGSSTREDERICGQIALPFKYPSLVEALESARRWRTEYRGPSGCFPVGSSPAVAELDRLMRQVADFDSTVLITGESGTGKELVARRIHELSGRSDRPFIPLNCCAIPRELLESELFGHEKGAFTGALSRRIGRFELAEGGTLFLDEIGDMSVDMQVKLLRVLQERTFERLGGVDTRNADVRILAATNRELETQVANGEFREDLFFRLNVFPIQVPPLRERLEDLPALINDLAKNSASAGRSKLTFSKAALGRLSSYHWPGNVRELANLIERSSILCADGRVDLESLPAPMGDRQHARNQQRTFSDIPSEGLDLRAYLGNIEKDLIRSALDQTGGTVAHAARLLNLRRTTLVEKLRKHDLVSCGRADGMTADAGLSKI